MISISYSQGFVHRPTPENSTAVIYRVTQAIASQAQSRIIRLQPKVFSPEYLHHHISNCQTSDRQPK